MQIWAESGKSALPICNYSQILYQFLTFTQNLKRSPKLILVTYLACMNLIQILLLLMPSIIHIPAHLLLSVAKNVIQPSCSIHLMISRIYIGWHRKTFPNLLYYPCHKTKSIIYSLSLVIMKLDIFNPHA